MTRIKNIHPGEFLQEKFLVPLEITAYRLSKDIDIPQTRISEIIKGNRRVTADTAPRLSRYFSNSAKFWLGLQDDSFRKILIEAQFSIHQEKVAENMNEYKQSLIEHDKKKADYIAYNQEIFDYYLNVFLIGLFEESLNFAMPSMHSLKEKIAFLKSEYKLIGLIHRMK